MINKVALRRWLVIVGSVYWLLGCATSPSEMRAGTDPRRVAEFSVPGRLSDVIRCYVSELDERMPTYNAIVRDKGPKAAEVQQRVSGALIHLHDLIEDINSVQIKMYVFSRDFTPDFSISAARAAASACERVAS